jgi:hypothetical protein
VPKNLKPSWEKETEVKNTSTILTLIGLLFILATSVFAAEVGNDDLSGRLTNVENGLDKVLKGIGSWSFYGQVHLSDFYTDYNEDAGDADTANFDLGGISRFGATVKRGNFGGKAEIGIDDDANAVKTRFLYGYYDLGSTRLTIGQDNAPSKTDVSRQVLGDYNMQQFAPVSINRRTQIKVATRGFELALLKLHAKGLVPNADNANYTGNVAEYLPKIEASYRFDADNYWAKVYGGFQTYKIETAARDFTINAYIAGLSGGVKFDPVYVNAAFMTGQNCAQYGLSNMIAGTNKPNDAWIENNKVQNQQTIGATLVAGVQVNKMVSLETGFGYVTKKSDRAAATEDDEAIGGYLQLPITIVKGWVVTPEVGCYDYKKDLYGDDEGSMWYAGFKNVFSI